MTTRVSKRMRRDWARNKLFRLTSGAVESFYLAPPYAGGKGYSRIEGCLILFSPEGIVICGDWCPEDNRGAVSSYGYGLEWFAKPMGEDYLCSKFLTKRYVPDVAKAYLKERIGELTASAIECEASAANTAYAAAYADTHAATQAAGRARAENLRSKADLIQQALDEDELDDQGAFVRLLDDVGEYDSYDCGNDYSPRDAEVLCAIQQRFVVAHKELQAHEVEQALRLASLPRPSMLWRAFYRDAAGIKYVVNAQPFEALNEFDALSKAYESVWSSGTMPAFRKLEVEVAP